MAGHSLKFMLFFSIIVLATAICPLTGNDRGTFTATSGNFRVDWWRPTDSTVSFNVSVTTAIDTWGAIGFSNDQLMPNTDVAIAGNTNRAGNMFVEDRWNPDRTGPTYDPQQNFMNTLSSRDGGVLYFSFTRNINSGDDSRDIDLESCVYVLWAFGGRVGNFSTRPASGLGGHSSKGVFPEQLCLCSGNPAIMAVSLAIILLGALVAVGSIF